MTEPTQPTILTLRDWGVTAYSDTYAAMREFTDTRTQMTPDELWIVQHPPVYTLGQAGRREHLLETQDIPVLAVDRGGQVTYHGPGQLVIYCLIDLKRRPHWGIKKLVTQLEQAVIDYLATYQQLAERRVKAPGVYVQDQKIAALGLRVRHGCSYHGLSFNIDMDLSPFAGINPCGYPDLAVTQVRDLGISANFATVSHDFLNTLIHTLEYHAVHWQAPTERTATLIESNDL